MKIAAKHLAGIALALVLSGLGSTSAQAVNNCTAAVADDHTGDVGVVQIQFGPIGGGLAYQPNCVKVLSTTSIQFVPVGGATFGFHPLVAGTVAGGIATPDVGSPITNQNSGTSQPAFQIATPGDYGYYCNNHAISFNMYGAILVVDADAIFADNFDGTP